MLITGGYHSIRTGAIFTSLTVGLCGTDRRFIFGHLVDVHLVLIGSTSRQTSDVYAAG